jgi:hypothetical protein
MGKTPKTTNENDTTQVDGNDAVGAEGEEVFDFLSATVTVEDRQFGSVYPNIQWVNGAPNKKREGGIAFTGGFFVSADQGVEIPGAEPYTLITEKAEEIEGYAIRDLVGFTPVRIRRSWMVEVNGQMRRFAWSEYDLAKEASGGKEPRGLTHILGFIKGVDGPVVVTCKGHVAKALVGMGQRDRGIIPSYGQKIVAMASRFSREGGKKGQDYPLCAFSLDIGPAREADGSPKFTEVGKNDKSSVTLPVWLNQPKAADQALLQRLFVGKRFAMYQQTFTESAEWQSAWDEDTLVAARNRVASKGFSAAPEGGKDDGLPSDNEVPV